MKRRMWGWGCLQEQQQEQAQAGRQAGRRFHSSPEFSPPECAATIAAPPPAAIRHGKGKRANWPFGEIIRGIVTQMYRHPNFYPQKSLLPLAWTYLLDRKTELSPQTQRGDFFGCTDRREGWKAEFCARISERSYLARALDGVGVQMWYNQAPGTPPCLTRRSLL